MVVALLAGARDSVTHAGGMPSSDARHFPQPFVGLPGKLLGVPAARHTCRVAHHRLRGQFTSVAGTFLNASRPFVTFEAAALADPDDVDHLVLVEDGGHGHGLLQMLLGPVDLIRDAAPV